MNTFEWKILTRLRENRGKPLTVYQIADNNSTATHNIPTGKLNGHSNNLQLARKALDNLVTEGYIAKQSRKKGTSWDTYYIAR